MKEGTGRFVMMNRHCCEYCGIASDLGAIGKTDFDFFPRDRAAEYVRGDRQVMKTGVPIINAIELAPEHEGSDRLIVYSKVALRDRHGRIIGSAGFFREIARLRATPKSYGRLAEAVQHFHTHYGQAVSIPRLAATVGISLSEFERRFHHLFGATPRQYLQRVRVNAACRLLAETEKKITEIALEVGFFDHSHLSRTFSRLMGVSPLAYRKAHMPE